jgi:tetratricopeptide (TPR) repeat protein
LARYRLGKLLGAKGDIEGAIREFREAIRLDAEFAEAHCNLGFALVHQHRYQDALPHFRLGHELGSKRADWRHASGEWLRNAEGLAEMEGRLDLVVSGQARPRDGNELGNLVRMLHAKSRHSEAARMWAEALVEDGSLAEDLSNGHRYNAACSAALASAAGGTDAAEWRGRALEWLRADIAARERAGLADTLAHWKEDPDLAAVRDRLDGLPAAEREGWTKLWADVDALLARHDR